MGNYKQTKYFTGGLKAKESGVLLKSNSIKAIALI